MISSQRYGTLRNLVDASLVDRRLLNSHPGYRLQIETQDGNYIVLASALATGGHYDYYSFADGIIRYSSDPGRAPSGLSAAPVR